MTKTTGRHSPAIRLAELRAILHSGEGVSVYDIAKRLEVTVKSARRYLAALERSGEPLYEEWDGKRKVYRLMPTARKNTIRLSTSQMLALFLSRRVFDFLEGTGFKEDLDDVFRQLEATIKRQDALLARHLDRKIFDVNEAPRIYRDRMEDVNEIITALIREEQLEISHLSATPPAPGRRAGAPRARKLLIDPYTLLVYKKGLYLVGFSHHHQEIRTFAFDGIRSVKWQKGDRFEYPDDYQPTQIIEGAFGLIGGEPVEVRIRFRPEVARHIRRSRWHPSQKIYAMGGGSIELVMKVALTVELRSWILGFGPQAEVLGPAELREDVVQAAREVVAMYGAAG